jgi:DNA repair protein RadD
MKTSCELPDVYEVASMSYSIHHKAGADPDHPTTLRVEYQIVPDPYLGRMQVSEFICLDHKGFARKKAEKWWRKRSSQPVPDSVERGFYLAKYGALRKVNSIGVLVEDGFQRVVDAKIGSLPSEEEICKTL